MSHFVFHYEHKWFNEYLSLYYNHVWPVILFSFFSFSFDFPSFFLPDLGQIRHFLFEILALSASPDFFSFFFFWHSNDFLPRLCSFITYLSFISHNSNARYARLQACRGQGPYGIHLYICLFALHLQPVQHVHCQNPLTLTLRVHVWHDFIALCVISYNLYQQ